MGFIKNVSRLIISTYHAVDNGVEELSNIVDEFGKSTDRYACRSRISSLKDEVKKLQALPNQYGSIINKKEEILIEYNKYIEIATGDEIKSYINEKSLLEIEITDEKLKKTFNFLNTMESNILALKNRLAIEKIQALNNLSVKFIRLMSDSNAGIALGSNYAKTILIRCRDKIDGINNIIKRLEIKRFSEDIEIYPSGEIKFKISKRDNKLHGRSVHYFYNGSKNKFFSFNNGCLEGLSRCWREDGSLVAEYNFCRNLNSVKIATYTSRGIKLIDGEIKNNTGRLSARLWNGAYIGKFKIKNGRVNRKTAILKILINLSFIVLVFKTLKSSEMELDYKDFIDTIKLFNNFSDEIFTMPKS